MLSAVEAVSSGLVDLFETTQWCKSKSEKERWHQDTRRSRRFHDDTLLGESSLRDDLHIIPQTLFPDSDDVMYPKPVSLAPSIGPEPVELISMAKNYFRNAKPGHFQKKVLNAYLQR